MPRILVNQNQNENINLSDLDIQRIVNFLYYQLNKTGEHHIRLLEPDEVVSRKENSTSSTVTLGENFHTGTSPSEMIIILGIFGIWFYSIGRIYIVWRNILNFSTEQPPILSWNSLLYYIRNFKKSASSEGVKSMSPDKNSVTISVEEANRNNTALHSSLEKYEASEDNPEDEVLKGEVTISYEHLNRDESADFNTSVSVALTASTEILLTPCSLKETLIF